MQENRLYAGEYRLLHKYLCDRYADRLVLTFAQIEDLTGFPLPDAAWHQRAWWDGAHSASWTLANRTATINLPAHTVLFERHLPDRPRSG